VTGDVGVGKSALLSKWFLDLEEITAATKATATTPMYPLHGDSIGDSIAIL
jgi:hypothetical protein